MSLLKVLNNSLKYYWTNDAFDPTSEWKIQWIYMMLHIYLHDTHLLENTWLILAGVMKLLIKLLKKKKIKEREREL